LKQVIKASVIEEKNRHLFINIAVFKEEKRKN